MEDPVRGPAQQITLARSTACKSLAHDSGPLCFCAGNQKLEEMSALIGTHNVQVLVHLHRCYCLARTRGLIDPALSRTEHLRSVLLRCYTSCESQPCRVSWCSCLLSYLRPAACAEYQAPWKCPWQLTQACVPGIQCFLLSACATN